MMHGLVGKFEFSCFRCGEETNRIHRSWIALCLAGVFAMVCSIGFADDESVPLYEHEPFDQITLDARNGNAVLRIYPLDSSRGKIPKDPKPDYKLRIRLIDYPDDQYDVAWRHIAKLELFKDLILDQAKQLAKVGEFDQAFRYYDRLRRDYPDVEGLDASIENYLFSDAGRAFRDGRFAEALSVLEELRSRNPKNESVRRAVIRVTDRLLAQQQAEKNYLGMRKTLERLDRPDAEQDVKKMVASWRRKLEVAAAKWYSSASASLEAGSLREADDTIRKLMGVMPDYPGAQKLSELIAARFPMVVVGVARASADANPRLFYDWAARRTGRLQQRMLVEFSGAGDEGGQYVCPFGTVNANEERSLLTLQFRTDLRGEDPNMRITGYDAARQLYDMADSESPLYSGYWQRIVSEIRVEDIFTVLISLKERPLRPEALLTVPMATSEGVGLASQPYLLKAKDLQEQRFSVNPQYVLRTPSQPIEIVERPFPDARQAIELLRRGAIDIIDRVYPADVVKVKRMPGVTVVPYRVPSTHVLILNFKRPYLRNRIFRRGLVYGINRDRILRRDLLGDRPVEGSRVISGPLPAGVNDDDPLGYGYDTLISARPYDPRLCATLTTVATDQIQGAAKKAGLEPPELGELTLVYPDEELDRVAASSIAQYLTAATVSCGTRPLPPGMAAPPDDNWDLWYAELQLQEPILDVTELLGSAGLSAGGTPYLELALRQLRRAKNWEEARRALHDIHRLAHEEVAVIPLWQIVEHFAVGKNLRGWTPMPVTLYQDVEQWQISPTRRTAVK